MNTITNKVTASGVEQQQGLKEEQEKTLSSTSENIQATAQRCMHVTESLDDLSPEGRVWSQISTNSDKDFMLDSSLLAELPFADITEQEQKLKELLSAVEKPMTPDLKASCRKDLRSLILKMQSLIPVIGNHKVRLDLAYQQTEDEDAKMLNERANTIKQELTTVERILEASSTENSMQDELLTLFQKWGAEQGTAKVNAQKILDPMDLISNEKEHHLRLFKRKDGLNKIAEALTKKLEEVDQEIASRYRPAIAAVKERIATLGKQRAKRKALDDSYRAAVARVDMKRLSINPFQDLKKIFEKRYQKFLTTYTEANKLWLQINKD